jgi:hypothetical protein
MNDTLRPSLACLPNHLCMNLVVCFMGKDSRFAAPARSCLWKTLMPRRIEDSELAAMCGYIIAHASSKPKSSLAVFVSSRMTMNLHLALDSGLKPPDQLRSVAPEAFSHIIFRLAGSLVSQFPCI